MHDWTDPTLPALADEWGLSGFSPDALRSTSAPLLDWLGDTGATKVAIHFDVDTIDTDEIQLGLGADLGGLSTAEARPWSPTSTVRPRSSPSPSPSSYLVR
jgi:arginase